MDYKNPNNTDFNNPGKGNFDKNVSEFRSRSNWTEMKGKMKQAYGKLTDDDLKYAEGKQDEWLGKIGDKIGKTAQNVKSWINSLG